VALTSFFYSARVASSDEEDEDDSRRKSPARYDNDMEEDDREEYDQYGSQSLKKQRVEVSLEMPQLPVPYSDDNKVDSYHTK
jgi:RNA polymerase-associated protein LEO1